MGEGPIAQAVIGPRPSPSSQLVDSCFNRHRTPKNQMYTFFRPGSPSVHSYQTLTFSYPVRQTRRFNHPRPPFQVGHHHLPPAHRRPPRLPRVEPPADRLRRLQEAGRHRRRRPPQRRVHGGVHTAGVARRRHQVRHPAAGAVRQRPRPGLLRHPPGADPRGAHRAPHVRVVREAGAEVGTGALG